MVYAMFCTSSLDRLFCLAPLGVLSAICRHQSPKWTILSHISCFILEQVIGFHVLLDSFHPHNTRASWWSAPVLHGGAVKILASVCLIFAQCGQTGRCAVPGQWLKKLIVLQPYYFLIIWCHYPVDCVVFQMAARAVLQRWEEGTAVQESMMWLTSMTRRHSSVGRPLIRRRALLLTSQLVLTTRSQLSWQLLVAKVP